MTDERIAEMKQFLADTTPPNGVKSAMNWQDVERTLREYCFELLDVVAKKPEAAPVPAPTAPADPASMP